MSPQSTQNAEAKSSRLVWGGCVEGCWPAAGSSLSFSCLPASLIYAHLLPSCMSCWPWPLDKFSPCPLLAPFSSGCLTIFTGHSLFVSPLAWGSVGLLGVLVFKACEELFCKASNTSSDTSVQSLAHPSLCPGSHPCVWKQQPFVFSVSKCSVDTAHHCPHLWMSRWGAVTKFSCHTLPTKARCGHMIRSG